MVKKINITLFFFLFFNPSLSAHEKIKLWNSVNATPKEKWSYVSIFLPDKPDTSGLSVIICPGGSYYWLDMDNEGFSVAKYLNQKGIAAFVLHYRTARRGNCHPSMINDLERTMQLVKENSAAYGINPDKVGVMGFSAGGHLAGTAAIYSQGALKPYFSAMIYPVVSMDDSICHRKSRNNLLGRNCSDELKQKMSLEKNICPNMPPVFLLHCTGDKTVDYRNSVVFSKALETKKVQYKFLLLDESGRGGHGFGIRPNGKATGWIDEFLEWVKKIEKERNYEEVKLEK